MNTGLDGATGTPARVEFYPSFGLLILPAVAFASTCVMQSLAWFLVTREPAVFALFGGLVLLVGVVTPWWARSRLKRPLLGLDAAGLHDVRGKTLCRWRDVGAVWIGEVAHAHVGGQVLRIWTDEAIAYSRATGFLPTAMLSQRLPVANASHVVAAVRLYTDAEVRTGDVNALGELIRWMREPEAAHEPSMSDPGD